ncbi:hypothetical protein KRR40_31900 [Niabella defluvii]|nr:hypothetical protein KRR40_31900 [Niabella sp. I65]
MSLQLQLLTQQVAMMQQGAAGNHAIAGNGNLSIVNHTANVVTNVNGAGAGATEELTAEEKIELKKPFGATARIEKKSYRDLSRSAKVYYRFYSGLQ